MGILAAIMVPHPPLIIPDIGKGEERKIQKTIEAYQEASGWLGAFEPETVVMISPHQTMYADYFHISPGEGAVGDFSQFRAGQVKMEVSYDTEFVQELCAEAEKQRIPAGTDGLRERKLDHGTMVPLYFFNQYWRSYRLVRIGLSGMPLVMHYELGECIRRTAEKLGRKAVVVASGDLSHCLKKDGPYGWKAQGPEYDGRIMDVMGKADFGELFCFSEGFLEKAGECGHRSFTMMAGAFDGTAVEARRLSYEGPFGVGYGVCTFAPKGNEESRRFRAQYEKAQKEKRMALRENEDAYVRLARQTVEEYVRFGKKPETPDNLLPEMYTQRAGVFVSLKKDGALRGCIGTIQAVRGSIAEEIIENAVSAAVNDPRFPPVRADELEKLTISVDVLGATEEISSPEELDVKRYGVVVSKGYKRGLLLPNLEGVDTVGEQIAIARQKAGISAGEKVKLERFEVVRHY